jgi:superfamily II DNA/RNA helicase
MLFSATMPGPVVALSRRYLRQPTHVRAESDDDSLTVPLTTQFVFRAHHLDKPEVLARVMQAEGRGLAMVFTRTKRSADRISADLTERGFAAAPVHGDLGQGAREQALRAFRNGKVDILVATDVAARGIDITGVTHVVNYECPDDEKTYVHRIGRTGRAGETGTAITFVDWEDGYRWGMINKALNLSHPEPEETYSNSPALYAELGIPTGAKGRLARSERTRAGLDAEVLEDLGETGTRRPPAKRDGDRPSGGGSRSGRGSGGGRSSGSGDSGRSSATATKTSDGPPRQRQRTRSGGTASTAGAVTTTEGASEPAAPRNADGTPRPARRRRRRSRAGAGHAEGGSPAASE